MLACKCDVAVIGGGLGGLAFAAGAIHRGFDCRVFEAAPQLRTASGTLIGLGGNAFRALEQLQPDIVPRIKASGAKCQMISRYVKTSPDQAVQPVHSPPLGGPDAEFYTIRWSEVQRVLAELVPPEAVHCGRQATGYTEHAAQGRVCVHFKDQPDVLARFVVAADGLRSALRATMVPGDPGPRYLGHMNWNALVFNPDNSVADVHQPGEIQTWWDRETGTPFQHSMYVIDAGGGYSFWQLRLASEALDFTPAPARPAEGPHGEKPYLTAGGMGKPGSKARVLALLDQAGFDLPKPLIEATPESDIFERAIMDRVPLDEVHGSMSSPGKRVVLLGDAAHAVHPGPGQGARTAFEDAHTLMTALEQHRAQLAGWQLPPCTLPHDSSSRASQDPQSAQQPAGLEIQGDGLPGDAAAVCAVVEQYERLRLVRTCRVQRFAAEGCGIPAIRAALRPASLSPQEVSQRFQEFNRWMSQYPENPDGDPDSVHWKPPSSGKTCVASAAA